MADGKIVNQFLQKNWLNNFVATIGKTLRYLLLFIIFRSSHQRCSVKKLFFRSLQISQGKYLCWSPFLIKLQALGPATLLQRNSNPVKFVKFLRIPILKNICEQLLLNFHYISHHHFNYHHFHYHQKQPFADILQNRCSQTFCIFYRKRLVLESLFHKVADLRPKNSSNIRIPLDYNIIPCPLQLNVFFFLQTYIFPQSYSKLFAFYSQ